MADEIALSTYIEQIETQIRRKRPEDARALCLHILRHYPKHIETYGLMAQTFTLQRDMEGALDLYRRVLSADPENVGAHVGVAHIFDDWRKLDEAVWHMERAYELAPTHMEIRNDLLRLYSRIEGAQRERLKLSRGGLARLYVQEGLYAQAVREYREISASDPSRFDTRVALAETLWRAGQTRQAADVAASLLDSLPYCLKANLILGTAWHESEIEESEAYLQRAQALDPSNQVAAKLLGNRSPLHPVQPRISRFAGAKLPSPLDAEVEFKTVPEKPEPSVHEEEDAGSILIPPDRQAAAQEQAPAQPEPAKTEPPTEPAHEWLAEPEPEPSQKASVALAPETPSETIAEATESAPVFEEPAVPQPSIVSSVPPWLLDEGIPAETPRAELPALAEPSTDAGQETPDWLAELRKTISEKSEEGTLYQAPAAPVIPFEEPPTQAPSAAAIPEADSEPAEQAEPASAISAEEAPGPFDTQALAAETPASEQESKDDTIPTWLQGAPPRPALVDTQKQDEERPAWMREPLEEKTASTEHDDDRAQIKMPKWVEVLTQRAREEEQAESRSVSAADESERTRPEMVEPEPAGTIETPSPEPVAIEPEPPIVIETPLPDSSAPAAISPAPVAEETEPTPSKPKRQPKYYARLAQAREHRDQNRWSDAFAEYEFVIQKAPRLVAEVIMDLEALVAGGDAPLDAHRLLGDAYARAGRLNDALERYRFVYQRVEE